MSEIDNPMAAIHRCIAGKLPLEAVASALVREWPMGVAIFIDWRSEPDPERQARARALMDRITELMEIELAHRRGHAGS